MHKYSLVEFVEESNLIEKIFDTTEAQVIAHEEFLVRPLSVTSLEMLVDVLQPGARLRALYEMNVYVGDHVPLPGGPQIKDRLTILLASQTLTPWKRHFEYETLHPFIDGNGRSGRALWLKDMGGINKAPLGFLHHWYYQTLQEGRK